MTHTQLRMMDKLLSADTTLKVACAPFTGLSTLRLSFAIGLAALTTSTWAQTYLTPNQLGSGRLPGTHADLVFTLSDGNWTPQVSLPATAEDKARIKIVSNAGYRTQVLQANTDVPLPSMGLLRGQTLHYQYTAARQRWEVVVPNVRVATYGKPISMPISQDRMVRIHISPLNWAPSVSLPPSGSDGDVVLVSSSAIRDSRIDPEHVLHASTMPLRRNDSYSFQYNSRLGKWTLQQGPQTTLNWSRLNRGQLPTPTTARTRLTVPSGAAATTLTLPSQAGDRDRIIVTSRATARSTIANTGVQGVGTMTIGQDQTYEFMWHAPNSRWVLMQAPTTQVSAQQVTGQAMPAQQTPVTELLAWNGSWRPSVTLPGKALPGDRVVVKSSATSSFDVDDGGTGGFGRHTVTTGEEVAFVRTGQSWQRETDTIRILLTYSQDASARLGADAIRARQIESLRLTNESLENSGAKFRFQMAGLMEVPTLSDNMTTSLRAMRSHTLIQDERNRVAADAVYYEGAEGPYCGQAFLNRIPSASNMASVGTINCGTTVMRHELGHNMGLGHSDSLIHTIMNPYDGGVPYFATPNRFDAKLGVAKSHLATVPDEVPIMDGNAPAVSRFR